MAKKKVIIEGSSAPVVMEQEVSHAKIHLLSIDYNNEGLNNIARKINELIEHLNA